MKQPLVSVVIPVYNREKTIMKAVNSVMTQTYDNFEIIVVDDCSTDRTFEILQNFKEDNISIIKQTERMGANTARNLGIQKAKGQYIAFQDSDDEWLPEKLNTQINYMISNNIDACYCAFYLHNNDYITIFPKDYQDKNKYELNLKQELKKQNVIGTPTLVIKKEVIKKVGNFSDKLPRLQDYEFVIRIIQQYRIGYVDEPLMHVYKTENSISENVDALKDAIIQIIKKHGNFININEILWSYFSNAEELGYIGRICKDAKELQCEITKLTRENEYNVYDVAIDYINNRYAKKSALLTTLYENFIHNIGDEKFYIYGAGNVAKKIYYELSNQGIKPYSFIVTSSNVEQEIEGIPISLLEECEDKRTPIIIGVALDMQQILVENLRKRNFFNIVVYPYV